MFTKIHETKSLRIALIAVLIVGVFGAIPAHASATISETGFINDGEEYTIIEGFHISSRNLLDANGNNFVMRGINHGHNWYLDETSSFANIKAKGANAVRVVLSTGYGWEKNSASDVANVIDLCKTNKLICVLEVHDTTGYGEVDAVSLSEAVDYWKEIKSVLDGQEAYVIINLGNEPYGNNNASGWIDNTKNAIAEMRSAGFQHTLMVDAPNWGQDWESIMLDNAADVLVSDPNGNLVFSIHMYGVYETASAIQNYVSTFVNAGLPLVIGEFGWNHSDGNPDEDAIMSIAQANGIGYLGWMWSGGSGGELDMVTNFDPTQETWWGNRIINGANGIKKTSCEASVYGGGSIPKVCYSARANPNPTNAASVDFTVTFSESVAGVDADDFVLTTTGVIDAMITNVSGSGSTHTVTVDTGAANGTIRLDVVDDDSIMDSDNNPLGGSGAVNGDFTSGETYKVVRYSLTLPSQGDNDGWILESTETSGVGGTKNNTATTLRLGDNAANRQYRAILSFDTPALPEGAVITSVTLKFKYAGKTGTLPFGATHGNLFADVREGSFRDDPILQPGDFNGSASKSKVLIFNNNNKVDNWYSKSFNPLDYPYLNFGGVTQFRLRFAKDDNNDFGADFLKIYSGNAVEANRPQLIIEYYVP